jgi:hypothetical protein
LATVQLGAGDLAEVIYIDHCGNALTSLRSGIRAGIQQGVCVSFLDLEPIAVGRATTGAYNRLEEITPDDRNGQSGAVTRYELQLLGTLEQWSIWAGRA